MKKLIILFVLFTSLQTTQAFLIIEPNASFGFGDVSFNETDTLKYEHNGSQYMFDLGMRAGLNLFGLMLGGVASHSQIHADGRRVLSSDGEVRGRSYNNSLEQNIVGGFIGLSGKSIKIWAEYYKEAKIHVTYSTDKTDNPFTMGTKMSGTGFGAGIQVIASTGVAIGGLVRKLSYDEFSIEGVKHNLPDSQFTKKEIWQFLFQGSLFFDI